MKVYKFQLLDKFSEVVCHRGVYASSLEDATEKAKILLDACLDTRVVSFKMLDKLNN